MMLLKVEYEFFDYEEPSSDAHELERQTDAVCVVDFGAPARAGRRTLLYRVLQSSYFSGSAARVIDASDSPLWSSLIRQEVELAARGESSRRTLV
jgi:hypothetical protein